MTEPRRRPLESDFKTLGLAPPLVAAVAALGTRKRRRFSAKPFRSSSRAATCWPGRHRHRQDRRVCAADDSSPAPAERRGARRTALVLVPTRELAMQVAEATHKYARGTGLIVVPLYGGASMPQQIRALDRGADIVVATPGRALDHLGRRSLRPRRRSRCSCSTKPTRCSTWALPRTSTPSSRRRRRRVRRRCSRRRCRRACARLPSVISAIPSASPSRAKRPPPGSCRASARSPTSSGARTKPPRCSACSTWRVRRRPWCSAAPGSRWTRWSRR